MTEAEPGADDALRVRVQRVEGAPVVAIRVSLPGGARVEPVPGLALLTGRMLAEGSRRRDHRELAEALEARGMLLHAAGTFESHGLALDALAGDWEEAVDVAAELVLEPAFPEQRCRQLARRQRAELESMGDEPEVRTALAFLDQLYHPNRRSRPLQGTAEALAALTPADCADFHRTRCRSGALLVVTGEIDEAAVERRLRERFASLAAAGGEAPEEPEPPRGRGRRRTVALPVPDDGSPGQAHLYAGHLTVERRHPDHEALALAAVVLGAGAGLTGRIPDRVRERDGLAYATSAQTVAGAGLDPGRLVVYAGTSAETVDRALAAVEEELERFVHDGPVADEVESARAYLVGREPFRRETARQVADLVARAEHYGLPLDRPGWRRERLLGLGAAEVGEAVRRHLHPHDLRVTVGTPAQETVA